MIKRIILLAISTAFLLSCNGREIKICDDKSSETEQVHHNADKTVLLSVQPNVFKLSEIPDTAAVIMTNSTNDAITTGLYYKIENYQRNEWKEISPKGIVSQDIGLLLKPGAEKNFQKKLYKDRITYKAGRYRIVKYYLKSDYQQTKENFKACAEFNIE